MDGSDPDLDAGPWFEGLDDTERAERRDLLEWLLGQGIGEDELLWAHEHGVLPFLAAGREIGGPRRYTAAEIARIADVDAGYLTRLRRAQGLPTPAGDERSYSDLDLRVAQDLHAWMAHGFDPEQIIGASRAIGRNLASAAEAMRSAMFELAASPGANEREIAERYARTTAALMPMTDRFVQDVTRQHLRNIMQSELSGAIDLATGKQPAGHELAVGFADLVGFTRMGEQLPPEELGRVADQLVETVEELVDERVKMVKTIGDAAMLTAQDPGDLVDFGLRLCARVEESGPETPQLRVGVDTGPVVARAGDVFGGPVNVASRLTSVARAGSVLTTAAVRDSCGDRFSFSLAGMRRLKGLPRPIPLFRARAVLDSTAEDRG